QWLKPPPHRSLRPHRRQRRAQPRPPSSSPHSVAKKTPGRRLRPSPRDMAFCLAVQRLKFIGSICASAASTTWCRGRRLHARALPISAPTSRQLVATACCFSSHGPCLTLTLPTAKDVA